MDIVRTNLKEIRGDIQVQTQPNLGTTFTLNIPFTLSILKVMIVEDSGFVFAIPVSSIREILRSQQTRGRETSTELTWQEQTIPLVRLRDHLVFRPDSKTLQMTGSPVMDQPLTLIVGDSNQFAGIHLSRFWGEQEATISTDHQSYFLC